MPSELPSGDMAVYVFLEMIALAFVFGAVDAGVSGKPWYVWAGCSVLAVLFFLAGIKWPQIKRLERIGSNRLYRRVIYSVIVSALLVSVGIRVYRHPSTEITKPVEPNPRSSPASPPTPSETKLEVMQPHEESAPARPQKDKVIPRKSLPSSNISVQSAQRAPYGPWEEPMHGASDSRKDLYQLQAKFESMAPEELGRYVEKVAVDLRAFEDDWMRPIQDYNLPFEPATDDPHGQEVEKKAEDARDAKKEVLNRRYVTRFADRFGELGYIQNALFEVCRAKGIDATVIPSGQFNTPTGPDDLSAKHSAEYLELLKRRCGL